VNAVQQSSEKFFRLDEADSRVSLVQARVDRLMLRHVRVGLQQEEILLTGRVRSWHEKQLAQEIVRDVEPRLRIRNHLELD
jgi:osmotically-inducible protein OsmY